tara:strand:+ start:2159 stop:2998 length:840 start_codon:yes stop_codon:yes gene_type:complete
MIEDSKKIFWLEKFEALFIEGEDSKRFLNGITTTNMNLERKFIQTCWLTPKGILRALIEIHFYTDKLLLITLEGNIKEIKNFLEDMIFPSDKVDLSDHFPLFRIQEIAENISWRDFDPKLFLKEDPLKYCSDNNINLIEPNNLLTWKIKQSIPRLNYEIDGNNNPLELGLYDLIDFNKGCYLGQESMARLNKISALKQEIRFWSANINDQNFKLINKKIYLSKDKKQVSGYITSNYLVNSREIIGLAMIKKKNLEDMMSYFNEDLGIITIKKSVGSVFF